MGGYNEAGPVRKLHAERVRRNEKLKSVSSSGLAVAKSSNFIFINSNEKENDNF